MASWARDLVFTLLTILRDEKGKRGSDTTLNTKIDSLLSVLWGECRVVQTCEYCEVIPVHDLRTEQVRHHQHGN